MNPIALLLGAGLAAALGKLYLDSKESTAQQQQAALQQQQLQLQLLQQQMIANAPTAAQPTQQGQTVGGAAASIIDGFVGILSLL